MKKYKILQPYQSHARRRALLNSIFFCSILLCIACNSNSKRMKEKILLGKDYQCFNCIYHENGYDSFPNYGICFRKNMKCYDYWLYDGVKTPFVFGVSHKEPSKRLRDNLVDWSISNDSFLKISSYYKDAKISIVNEDTLVLEIDSERNPREIYIREK